jgi:hypothetical protein
MKTDWTKTIEGMPMVMVRELMLNLRRWLHTRDDIANLTRYLIIKTGRQYAVPLLAERVTCDERRPCLSFGETYIFEMVSKGRVEIIINGQTWSPAKVRRTGKRMTDALIAEGLLRPATDEDLEHSGHSDKDLFALTDAGISLCCARKIKRFDRATAERYVAELLDRADAINANPDLLCRVKRIVAYGSFIRKDADLGDIDLVAELERKIGGDGQRYVDVSDARCKAAGLDPYNIWDYGKLEVDRLLRARKRYLQLIVGYKYVHQQLATLGCPTRQIYPRRRSKMKHLS